MPPIVLLEQQSAHQMRYSRFVQGGRALERLAALDRADWSGGDPIASFFVNLGPQSRKTLAIDQESPVMPCTRRDLIRTSAAAICGAVFGPKFVSAQGHVSLGNGRLVLLGTRGGPFVSAYSPSPSANLLIFNGVPYVIDTGYGVSSKLIEAGVPLAMLRYVFITHHHSDHNLELGPLLYNSWVAGLRTPVDVYAPVGLKTLLTRYWESNAYDLETRIADEGRLDLPRLVIAHEYSEGSILTNPDVKVSALRNIHPPVTESYALKFQFGAKTVVFSGDTTYFPPLAAFGFC